MIWLGCGQCVGVFGIYSPIERDGRIMEGSWGVDVMEYRYVDGYFPSPSGTDVGCQCAESGVSVYYFIGDEETSGRWTWGIVMRIGEILAA